MKDNVIKTLHALLDRAYSPYSKVKVAAAVTYEEEGKLHTEYGVNVENVSFGLTNCAERVAIGSAITKGMRKIREVHIISNHPYPLTPCGACRQVIAEFAEDAQVPIYSQTIDGEQSNHFDIDSLLPSAFSLTKHEDF